MVRQTNYLSQLEDPTFMSKLYQYDLRYSRLSLDRLLQDMYSIEAEVIAEVYKTCYTFAEKRGAEIRGDLLYFDNVVYKIYIDFQKFERLLNIHFYPLEPTRSITRARRIDISGFGAVGAIALTYPNVLTRRLRRLEEILYRQLSLTYLGIESIFARNFRSFGDVLFNQLYIILNLEIERQNKSALVGKAYFSVTSRKNYQFRYFFDSQKLQLVIDHFKKNQIPEFSPIELVAALIAEEATDTMNKFFEGSTPVVKSLPSGEFASLNEDFRFWSAEALMVDHKELAGFPIAETETLLLDLNCHREIEYDLLPILGRCGGALAQQFTDNIRQYIKYSKTLAQIPVPKPKGTKLETIAEFLGTVLGSGTAEFLKDLAAP